MAGLPGAVHYALAFSLCRTQKVLSGLKTQTTPDPLPAPLHLHLLRLVGAADVLEGQDPRLRACVPPPPRKANHSRLGGDSG